MPTTCGIYFGNPDGVYYAGQLLSGTVRLTLTREKNVHGVFVHIFGRAYAHWTTCRQGRNQNDSDNRVSYSGSEDYLDEKIYVVGSSSGEIKLEPGTYNYNFQCMLPAELPTSVEHAVGHIAYLAKVFLDTPLWMDKEFKEYFTVIKPINLNLDPTFREPAAGVNGRLFYSLRSCYLPSGPLTIKAGAPVRGYTPGQIINMIVEVSNESVEEAKNINVDLVKKITFYGHRVHKGRNERDTKTVDHVITGGEMRGCPSGQKFNFFVNLRVPSISPTDYSTSNIIHVRYFVRVTGVMASRSNKNSVVNLPVTIGTYPILDDPQVPDMPTALPAPEAPFPNDDPPTYEEAMASAGGSTSNYKPKYPVFRRPTSYSTATRQNSI